MKNWIDNKSIPYFLQLHGHCKFLKVFSATLFKPEAIRRFHFVIQL